ncbi:MAG: YidH family protein [Methylophilus sp.]
MTSSDPRVFFAAERTLLAWLRTGLTIMAIGFVISRFGLFLQLIHTQSGEALPLARSVTSAILGISFVLTGSIAIIAAAIFHQRFIATLPQADIPTTYSKSFALILSFIIALLGIGLACYLLMTEF